MFKRKDSEWTKYNKELMKHAKEGNWGLYRNTRLAMGDFLKKEKRLKECLETYLAVIYLDFNGPTNGAGFKLDAAFPAPAIIERINKLIIDLNLTEEEVKGIFLGHNEKVEKALKLILPASMIWYRLTSPCELKFP